MQEKSLKCVIVALFEEKKVFFFVGYQLGNHSKMISDGFIFFNLCSNSSRVAI